ncbi:hypothetical protein GCM10011519_05450 [Marmoricola endophyticus]|uniref:Uncharacterized protein n=1 Tax=Marmoricola endophyticus TaxID=2040280 RepID=A0A917F1Y3_9ACTN|nr:hypothetical protein [Marmoricola endophyticus]GGF34909.1 hypothetical protein GCM10011519_05450 [Marmoricola endophyticus]
MSDHLPTDRRRPPRSDGAAQGDSRVLRQAMWAVLAIAVIGLSLFAGSLVFGGTSGGSPSAESTVEPMTSAPAPPSSPAPSSSSPATPQPTAESMTTFLDDYLRDVSDDPATAWGSLTPGFQRTSGGFAAYREFWAPIAGAEPADVEADPEARTIAYDVTYTYADGHTTQDSTRLTLAYENGTYRISGEG